MNPELKLIVSKRIPLWLIPLRYCYRLLAKKLPKKVKLKQISFLNFEVLIWAHEDIGKKLILTKSFERDEIRYLAHNIRKGDTCFDVGGNTGIYAMLFAKSAGEAGKVKVFEPINKNVLAILLAAEINNFSNVQVFTGVASNKNGKATITTPEMDGAYAHIVNAENGFNGVSVESITLDTFMDKASISNIDILKIDVEGAEFDVLRGADRILSNKNISPRIIMVELFNKYLYKFDSSIPEILGYMENFGYLPYFALPDGSLAPYTSKDVDRVFNVFFLKG